MPWYFCLYTSVHKRYPYPCMEFAYCSSSLFIKISSCYGNFFSRVYPTPPPSPPPLLTNRGPFYKYDLTLSPYMSNLQPNWCLKIDLKKVDQHAGSKWLIHDTKRRKDNQLQSLKLPCRISKLTARCDIKGSDGTMLNPIFWKKVQGQKHPGRWGILEHQIPSIIVLSKTNAKSHKLRGIKLLSSESKTQLVNQRKQNSYRRAYIYIYIYIYTYIYIY